jgi:hypothetical protein
MIIKDKNLFKIEIVTTVNKKNTCDIVNMGTTHEAYKDRLEPVRTGFSPVRKLIKYGLTANRTAVKL